MGGLAFCVVLGGLRAINGCILSLVGPIIQLRGCSMQGAWLPTIVILIVGRLCFHSYKLTRCFSCIPSFLCPLDYIILWVCFLPHCLPLHPLIPPALPYPGVIDYIMSTSLPADLILTP